MLDISSYQNLAEEGDISAQVYVGWMYLTGTGVDYDSSQAEHWLNKAAEVGSREALFYLGKLFEKRSDPEKALAFYKKSAECHFWPGCYQAGRLYQLNCDLAKANHYFKRGMENDHLYSMRQYSVNLIKSGKFKNVLQGGCLFIKSAIKAYSVFLLNGENDERVRR